MRFSCLSVVVFLVFFVCCSMAFEKPKPKACMKVCTDQYEPVCAGVKGSKDKPQSFGSVCVMNNYNCESGKDFTVVSNGECAGSTSIRLS